MFKRIESLETQEPIEEEFVMKEIVFDQEKHMVSPKGNLRPALDALMGLAKEAALVALEALVAAKEISEFKVMPMGAVVTQDYRPSRVLLTIDAGGLVIDAQQG